MSEAAQSVEIAISPENEETWGVCSGTYNAVNDGNGTIDRYIHKSDPSCQIIRDYRNPDNIKWRLSRMLPLAEVSNWIDDANNQNEWLSIFNRVPLWYNLEGEGGEDIPCYACAGNVQFQTGEFTQRFNYRYSFETVSYTHLRAHET